MKTLNETARWIGWIGIIDVLHLSEQMLFGLGELEMLKHMLAGYYGWFRQPDYGTVVLAIVASTMLFSVVFAAMAGGVGRIVAGTFVGVIAISEVHHLCESVYAAHYTPGSVTAIPYVAAGVMLFRSLFRERQKAGEMAQAAHPVYSALTPALGIRRWMPQPGVPSSAATSETGDGLATRRSGGREQP